MIQPFENYEAAKEWLFSLKSRGVKYGIDRMRILAEKLGSPEKSFPVIHVAGTNGKGSVCAMLERVYRKAGLRTGLYTSPHLVRQGERVQVCRKILSESQILAYTNQLLPVAQVMANHDPDDHPSFFEWMTALAFLHFQQEMVDVAILETGLGGRLDATNVVQPEASVITSIGLDHTEILGDTLQEIATEKAGIIKPGCPVVVGRMPDPARETILQLAVERGAPAHCVEDRFSQDELPESNLAGTVQRWNTATAILTCEILTRKFPVDLHQAKAVLKNVSWRCRWSREETGGRTFYFDAAHNAEAAEALCENLANLTRTEGRRPVIVAGFTSSMQRAVAILPVIREHAVKLILVQPQHPRGLASREFGPDFPFAEIDQLFPGNGICKIEPEDATVVVTGSAYLVAEAYERLTQENPRGQQILQD